MREALDIWTIYRYPRDYPDKYVARRAGITNGSVTNTNEMFVADSLAEARKLLPAGLHRIERHSFDDPVIVECWV